MQTIDRPLESRNEQAADRTTILIFSLLFGGCTLFLYSYLIFWFLPPAQLVKYTRAAELYLHHQLTNERMVDFSPVYLYVHVFAQKMFSNPRLFIYWIHILLQSISTIIFFRILVRFFRLPIAIIATLAFVLEIQLILYNQAFEPEPVVLFFLLSSVYFAYGRDWIHHATAGILLGLGILTRPNFSPLLLVAPFHFYFLWKAAEGSINLQKFKRSLLVFCIPVVLAILGLWSRNAAILGYFSPVVMNPGTAIFEGNNPNSPGQCAVYPYLVDEVTKQYPSEADYHHEIYRRIARLATGKQLTVPQVNAYWSRKAFQFLIDHPAYLIGLVERKLFHIFHQFEWHDLGNAYWGELQLRQSLLPAVPFALITALSLIGMLVAAGKWRQYLLFYSIFFLQVAFMLVVYPSARQRVAVIPFFFFFACAAVEWALQTRKRLIVMLVALLPLFLVLHIETDIMKEERHLWKNIQSSNEFLRDARLKRNKNELRQASLDSALSYGLAPWFHDSKRLSDLSFESRSFELSALLFLHPQNFSQSFDYAIVLLESGNLKRAADLFKELIQSDREFMRDQYQSASPYFYLAQTAHAGGDHNQALSLFKTALKNRPGDPEILAWLTALTGEVKYKEQLFRYFDDLDANFYLGRAYLENKKGKEAAACFEYIAGKLPEYRRAKIYLAAALQEAGENEKAANVFRQAVLKSWDPIFLEPQITAIFEQLSLSKPADPFAQYSYAVVLRKYGHYQTALQALQKAQSLDPSNRHIDAEIIAVRELAKANQKTS